MWGCGGRRLDKELNNNISFQKQSMSKENFYKMGHQNHIIKVFFFQGLFQMQNNYETDKWKTVFNKTKLKLSADATTAATNLPRKANTMLPKK